MTETKKPSALDTLRALANKKPAVTGSSPIVAGMSDPAIAGAKRDKNTVKLGFDPAIDKDATYAARLKLALEKAESDFKVQQAKMRDYGFQKRGLYNDTFKTNVTTVCVPYVFEIPTDDESATPGRETRYVQVICSNKYSVQQEIVLNNKETIGEAYDTLFEETKTKSLKPNAEQLIREIFKEMGVVNEELENTMNTLFEEHKSVSTRENYESDVKKTPKTVQEFLSQSVTRVQPGLKFPI